MARRMFSPDITSSDHFLDMGVSARELYFQLGMNADDDGFTSPKKVMRMTGASYDDLKILVQKNFIIPFDSGVVAITHWRTNNLLRKDWYHPTIHKEERKNIALHSGKYSIVNDSLTQLGSKVDNKINTTGAFGTVNI